MTGFNRFAIALAFLAVTPVAAKPEANSVAASRKPGTLLAASADAPAAPAEPQRTSATFGDWIVRCEHAGTPPKKVCEAVQTFSIKGNQTPFAQIVFAHLPGSSGAVDGPLTMLLILPVNLALDKQPSLAIGSDTKPVQLLRCLPEGCVASTQVAADTIKQLRGAKTATATFFDAASQKINLPLSPKGFASALDNLATEISKDSGSAAAR